jgi:hypothetical protein
VIGKLNRGGTEGTERMTNTIQSRELVSARVRNILVLTVLVLTAMIGISCAGAPGQTYWEDGNFKVYATDQDFDATKLGYNHRPGLVGLVNAEVVAAGSTKELVFVERRERGSQRREFYIVEKEESNDTHSGKVKGPLSEEQFEEIRKARKLPEFAWRKKER